MVRRGSRTDRCVARLAAWRTASADGAGCYVREEDRHRVTVHCSCNRVTDAPLASRGVVTARATALRASLLKEETTPPAKAMRAIYYLRSYCDEDERLAVNAGAPPALLGDRPEMSVRDFALGVLVDSLASKRGSALIRHELAYVLGQIGDFVAVDVLEETLRDVGDNVMVRHECAEALGAIGAPRSLAVLRSRADDSQEPIEVRETCIIARDFLEWKLDGERGARPAVCACMLSPYSSVDPAPPPSDGVVRTTADMHAMLADSRMPLFKRYEMMFGLRNSGGEGAVRALGRVLVEDTSSAVLRHEVAYVMGQMQHPAAMDALATALRKDDEHNMVRHEAAEALGAIEGDVEEMRTCRALLREFSSDSDVVVRESCEVALDAQDYWSGGAVSAEKPSSSFKLAKEALRMESECSSDEVVAQQQRFNHFNLVPR